VDFKRRLPKMAFWDRSKRSEGEPAAGAEEPEYVDAEYSMPEEGAFRQDKGPGRFERWKQGRAEKQAKTAKKKEEIEAREVAAAQAYARKYGIPWDILPEEERETMKEGAKEEFRIRGEALKAGIPGRSQSTYHRSQEKVAEKDPETGQTVWRWRWVAHETPGREYTPAELEGMRTGYEIEMEKRKKALSELRPSTGKKAARAAVGLADKGMDLAKFGMGAATAGAVGAGRAIQPGRGPGVVGRPRTELYDAPKMPFSAPSPIGGLGALRQATLPGATPSPATGVQVPRGPDLGHLRQATTSGLFQRAPIAQGRNIYSEPLPEIGGPRKIYRDDSLPGDLTPSTPGLSTQRRPKIFPEQGPAAPTLKRLNLFPQKKKPNPYKKQLSRVRREFR